MLANDLSKGLKMAKIFYYMIHTYGRKKTLSFLSSVRLISLSDTHIVICLQIVDIKVPSEDQPNYVSLTVVQAAYESFVLSLNVESSETDHEAQTETGQSEDTKAYVSFDRIFEDAREEQGAIPLKKIQDYVDRLAAGKKESENGRGHIFFNGRHLPLNDVSICSLSL